jgi:ketosteroid isomerase-like protein
MTTNKERAFHLFQNVYYANVDRGDMTAATAAFHPDVDWSHAQVWAHHDFARGHAQQLHGRDAVREFLAARVEQLREAKITHHVRDMIVDGDKGAFIGAVEGPGAVKQFMVWFELRDGLVARYVLRPL